MEVWKHTSIPVGSILATENMPIVCTSGWTLIPRFPMEMAKTEKNNIFIRKKFSHRNIRIWHKQGPIFSSLSMKNMITLCPIWVIFTRKQRGHTLKGRNQNLGYPIAMLQCLSNWMLKKMVPVLSSLVAIGRKRHFSKILTSIFKFGCFSEKDEFDIFI